MDFTIEKLTREIIEEVEVLAELHYEEVAPYNDIPLNVDWRYLMRCEELGSHLSFIVRKEGKIVGYANYYLNYSIEYSSSYQASLGNIFIHPNFRGIGIRFMRWCDEQLKNFSVQVVYHPVKVKNDYGKLLERLGYEKMNVEYSKRLDKTGESLCVVEVQKEQ